MEAMNELIRLSEAEDDDVAQKQELCKIMQKAIIHQVLIPTALGASNQGLAAKFAAVLHALRIEADDWSVVQKITQSMLCLTTDYGGEASLGSVPSMDANTLYTHWREDGGVVDDSAINDVEQVLDSPKDVSLSNTQRVPGIELMLLNALDQVTDLLHGFDGWFSKAKELGHFLGNSFCTDRLVHHCLHKRGAEKIEE